eukprot:1195863-Prorocentrum_minimum.AAC.3
MGSSKALLPSVSRGRDEAVARQTRHAVHSDGFVCGDFVETYLLSPSYDPYDPSHLEAERLLHPSFTANVPSRVQR